MFKCYYESGRLHSQGMFFNHLTVDEFCNVTERPTFVGRYYKYSDDEKNDLLEESDYEYIEND